jgi:hypothetical protein
MREEVAGQAYPRSAAARIAVAGIYNHAWEKDESIVRAWPSFQSALASMNEKF